jgi:integrase
VFQLGRGGTPDSSASTRSHPQAADQNRDRFLTDAEFQVVLRGSNPANGHRTGAPYRRLLLAMDWTMCRPGELSRLQWSDVHFERNVAILTNHKTKRTGKPKIIPLIPKMKRLLGWLQARSTSPFCFTNSRNRPWTISSIDRRMQPVGV